MNTKDFCKEHGITSRCVRAPLPTIDREQDWTATSTSYLVTLSRRIADHENTTGEKPGGANPERKMTLWYFMGSAHKQGPTSADVLDSLALDSDAMFQSFEEWASDLGYDADSRKAWRTYEKSAAYGRILQGFLGEKLFMELRTEVERL